MSATWSNRLPLLLVGALALGALIVASRSQPARAALDEGTPLTGARYTVVESEAHNLIVTDNKTNTLYFYTIDKEKEVGSDLILRGSIDLNRVGKSPITPTKGSGQ
jgi:hypothetical protein